jgi:3'-5' exonuclease
MFDHCTILGGFNIISFDIPFLCRRYMVHGMKIPAILNTYGLKPREINHIDVMNMWKMSGISAGLETLCCTLGIPSSKG